MFAQLRTTVAGTGASAPSDVQCKIPSSMQRNGLGQVTVTPSTMVHHVLESEPVDGIADQIREPGSLASGFRPPISGFASRQRAFDDLNRSHAHPAKHPLSLGPGNTRLRLCWLPTNLNGCQCMC